MANLGNVQYKRLNTNLLFNFIKGISPLISNPTRQFVIKDSEKKDDRPPVAAMLQSALTNLHNHHSNDVSVKGAVIAFPNDRAASIRCEDHHEQFR